MNPEIKGAWKHRELRILVIGEGVSMFGSLVSRLAAALCLGGRDVRKVHTAADAPVASEATGVMS